MQNLNHIRHGARQRLGQHRKRFFLPTLLAGSLVTFLLCRQFLYSSVVILGSSMEPTLREGDRRLVNHWHHRIKNFSQGDLVVVQEPGSDILVVKRIIATPGDTIQLRDDGVYVNGTLLREPYVPASAYTHARRMGERIQTLGPNEYFVMGDNRLVSLDSRWYGPVPRNLILGTVSN